MKTFFLFLILTTSFYTFALEGCEVIARSGNAAQRDGAKTSRNFSLERCAKKLIRVVNQGEWDIGVAEHANKDGEFTYLKYEHITKEEFIQIRNNRK
jgi:hypothetical protein